MIFIETPIFTAELNGLLADEEYAEFQRYLADNPRLGDVIQSTGGLRKIRLLLIYKKGVQDNLTEKQKKILCQLNEGW